MHPYGPAFWFAYLANTALMIAVSMMFRYADLITHLGGSEYELGWIVGIGMCGGMAMRMVQGKGIDRYGSGNIWIASGALVCASLLGHLWIDRLDTPLIYVLRILYMISLAGAFGASITFVSLRAPVHRTGEMIGALGSSGFVGMAVGPIVVDAIFRHSGDGRTHVDRMFAWAAAMAGLSMLGTIAAQRMSGEKRPLTRKTLPTWWILRRYHPGPILFVGVAMGMGIGVPFYFLRPFAQQLGIEGIRGFFFTYATVAFAVRVICRRLPDRWGVRRTVLLGMGFLIAELLSFMLVYDDLTLMLPATLGGLAHAFVFPAAMTGGSLAFPTRYRGIATTLMLTMFDLGNLVGQPAVGTLLHVARQFGWPAYPTMFISVAAVLALASFIYVGTWARKKTWV